MADAQGGSLHQRRVRRMLYLGSGMTAATSLCWGGFFVLGGNWWVVAIDATTFALAAAAAQMTRSGHLRGASRLLMAVLFGVLFLNAAVYDIPSVEVPRSGHQFLLALGVGSCLLTRDEPAWLRHGIPIVCFLTYLGFASNKLGWVTPFALSDSVRASGVWINHIIAMVGVYATVLVIQADVTERNVMETELHTALLRGELFLHYQPQVVGDRVVGAEALARWRHPQRGMVSPAEFIPVAERCGLMLPLGEWVMKTACTQLAAWSRRPETAALQMAVNVSASQFAQPDFVARVLDTVAQAGVEPSRLKLELTESMLAHDIEDIIAKMTALKAQGIGFALDDFGTGFSSLSYLRRLPLDQLKIDQSFVRAMLNSTKEAAIAQTVVELGRSLDLAVLAEGVETAEQREFLHRMGCDAYQGYLFGRPVASEAFEALLMRPTDVQAQRAEREIASVA